MRARAAFVLWNLIGLAVGASAMAQQVGQPPSGMAGATANPIRIGGQAGTGQPASPLLLGIDSGTTIRILKGAGFARVEPYARDGTPHVKAVIGDTDTYVWHEDCENGSCSTLIFAVNFGVQPDVGESYVADYNLNTVYTKMTRNRQGELLLTMATSVYKGVTEDHVRAMGDLWLTVFKEALEYKPRP